MRAKEDEVNERCGDCGCDVDKREPDCECPTCVLRDAERSEDMHRMARIGQALVGGGAKSRRKTKR